MDIAHNTLNSQQLTAIIAAILITHIVDVSCPHAPIPTTNTIKDAVTAARQIIMEADSHA